MSQQPIINVKVEPAPVKVSTNTVPMFKPSPPSFQEKIHAVERAIRKPGRFKELCASIVQSVEGAEWLSIMCAASHPLNHRPGLTDNEHGEMDVIGTIWANGSGTNTIFAAVPDETPAPD